MQRVHRGVAVICVLSGWLVMPARAEACVSVTVSASWSSTTHSVEASTNVQLNQSSYPCDIIQQVDTFAYVWLQTPSTTLDDYDWGEWQAMATISISPTNYAGGWGEYYAWGRGRINYIDPFSQLPGEFWTDMHYASSVPYIPSPYMELDGPTSVARYGGAIVTASVDPWQASAFVQWQGCTPASGYPSVPSCSVNTDQLGVKTVTATIQNGPTEQWFVEVF